MRQLEASIRTFNIDRVKVALTLLGVTRLEISEAQLPDAGGHGAAAFLPKVRVQVTVPDVIADRVVELLAEAS
jgi:nitrogen regulatory protein P-II 1